VLDLLLGNTVVTQDEALRLATMRRAFEVQPSEESFSRRLARGWNGRFGLTFFPAPQWSDPLVVRDGTAGFWVGDVVVCVNGERATDHPGVRHSAVCDCGRAPPSDRVRLTWSGLEGQLRRGPVAALRRALRASSVAAQSRHSDVH
jgi:hypothetical protein